MTTVKHLMERVSTVIAENPGRASEFGGVYKSVLDGDEWRTFAMKLKNLDEMGDWK